MAITLCLDQNRTTVQNLRVRLTVIVWKLKVKEEKYLNPNNQNLLIGEANSLEQVLDDNSAGERKEAI